MARGDRASTPATQSSNARYPDIDEGHDSPGAQLRQVPRAYNAWTGEHLQTYLYSPRIELDPATNEALLVGQDLRSATALASPAQSRFFPAFNDATQSYHHIVTQAPHYRAAAGSSNSQFESPAEPDDGPSSAMQAQQFAAGQHHTTFEGDFLCGNTTPFSGRYDTGADDNFVTKQAVRQAGMSRSIQRSRTKAMFYHVSDGTNRDSDEDDDRNDFWNEGEVDKEIEGYIVSHQALARRRDGQASEANTGTESRNTSMTMGPRLDLGSRIRLQWYDRKARRRFDDWFYVIENCPYDMLLGASFVFQHGIFEAVRTGVPSVMPLVRVPQSRDEKRAELLKLQQQEIAARQAEAVRRARLAQQAAQSYHAQQRP